MSTEARPLTVAEFDLLEKRILAATVPRYSRGLPLAIVLFVTTFVVTTYAGYVMAVSPLLDVWSAQHFFRVVDEPLRLVQGLPFSLALMSILLSHELGHYLACVYYRLDSSPPYFVPAPTIVGTFGAFIRIRSPIPSRRILFDVGASGPLAGFVMTLAYLGLGLMTADPARLSGFMPDFGTPWLMQLGMEARFGYVPSPLSLGGSQVLFASWVGCFITALNLLPVGQLDGGHVLHAMIGRWSRPFGLLVFAGVVALLFTTGWLGWLIWAVLLLILGLRHPNLPDPRPLGWPRQALGVLCFAVFVLCFIIHPIRVF